VKLAGRLKGKGPEGETWTGAYLVRITLASVISPLAPKCSRSLSSVTCSGMFFTHSRDLRTRQHTHAAALR